MAQICPHLDQIADVEPDSTEGCSDCLAIGSRGVHLRMCMIYGHVACCDDSPNRHGTAHYRATRHPITRSLEPGKAWYWCYEDEIAFEVGA